MPDVGQVWTVQRIKRRLTNTDKQQLRFMHGTAIIANADAELCEAGLQQLETLANNYSTFPGMRLILPDGTKHSIPRNAEGGTFFTIPGRFFSACMGALLPCETCGFEPLSDDALRLYVVLCSRHDRLRYGGVDPDVLSFRNRKLIVGCILSSWDRALVGRALRELEDKRLVSRRRSTISTIGGKLLRRGSHARHPDEQNVTIIAIKTR